MGGPVGADDDAARQSGNVASDNVGGGRLMLPGVFGLVCRDLVDAQVVNDAAAAAWQAGGTGPVVQVGDNDDAALPGRKKAPGLNL
jgi:hypothetical protein